MAITGTVDDGRKRLVPICGAWPIMSVRGSPSCRVVPSVLAVWPVTFEDLAFLLTLLASYFVGGPGVFGVGN